MAAARLPQDYVAHLETLAVDPEALVTNERGTIPAPRASRVELEGLPRLRTSTEGDGAELRLEREVARGGMGAVHLATQIALQRQVAVKRPVDDSERSRAGLLGEALVTGALQHPNVVPVHALGRDAEGQPVLVMRFIEGTRWSERIAPLFPDESGGDDDPVDEQLRILLQVCNAVELAHAMHILHLDLKPDNVMLGQFGEVYVLDWGLAAATDERAPARLRLAADIRHVAGTPAYMAPEMAAAEGALIGEHTDVYLLGAVLFELITGRPPHLKERLLDSLASAFASDEIPFEDVVPPELQEVCRRAMRFEPEARYRNVRSFREAVLAFLRHRSSARAAAEAIKRLDALDALPEDDDDGYAEIVAEARFGLRQALQEWSDNEQAKEGLRQLVRRSVDWHLARDDVRGATSALRDLPEPSDDLRRRVEAKAAALTRRERAREREIHELRERVRQGRLQQAPRVKRNIAIMLLSLSVPVVVLTVLRLGYGREAGYPEALGVAAFFTLVLWLLQLHRRGSVTVMEQKIRRTLALGLGSIGGTLGLCWLAGVDLTVAIALATVPLSALLVMGGLMVEPGFSWGALPLVAAAVGILIHPPWRGPIFLLGAIGAFSLAGRAWGRRQLDEERQERERELEDGPLSRR